MPWPVSGSAHCSGMKSVPFAGKPDILAANQFKLLRSVMQVIVHTGAHYTDEERLMKCLLKNKQAFSNLGVAVPGPGKYRKLLRQTLIAMRKSAADPDAREVLLDAILDEETADRVILSNTNFFGAPRAAVRRGKIYPAAAERMSHFQQLFPDDEVEMFMGLRDPGSFLPAIYKESPKDELHDFLDGADPRELRWSKTIRDIKDANPGISITVWCNEDTPLIWSQIIRDMAGMEPISEIEGAYDLLSDIISPQGMARFKTYLTSHPTMTEVQRRRVISAFLDKFALEDEIIEELDLPGWTDQLVGELTDIYEEDVLDISRMPGVQLISP